LTGANLSNTDARFANFTSSLMKNAKLVGIKANNASFKLARMSGADCRNGHFMFSNFDRANIWLVNMTGAWINYANFTEAIINQTNLTKTKQRFVDFTRAKITRVKFNGAELISVKFKLAQLKYANLNDAAILQDIDFRRLSYWEGPGLYNRDLRAFKFRGTHAWPYTKNCNLDSIDARETTGILSTASRFNKANFSDSKFSFNTTGGSFIQANFNNVRFDFGTIKMAMFDYTKMTNMEIVQVEFNGGSFKHVDFTGTKIHTDRTTFINGTNLKYARIPGKYKSYFESQDVKGLDKVTWLYEKGKEKKRRRKH